MAKWQDSYRVGQRVQIESYNSGKWLDATVVRKTASGKLIVRTPTGDASAADIKGRIRPAPPEAPATPVLSCVFRMHMNMRCGGPLYRFGHCIEHVVHSPEERQLSVTLRSALDLAKAKRDEFAEKLLLDNVVLGDTELPAEARREYRVLWYRVNYLNRLRADRRPGDDLPAEVTMR